MKQQKLGLIPISECLDELRKHTSYKMSLYYDVLYEISTFIFDKRINSNMSRKDFAKVLGVTPQMLLKYESGDYNFSLFQLCDICEKLNLKVKSFKIEFEEGEENENT